MEEKLTPVVTLGGRTFPLRMTHGVLMRFSQITRVGLDQLAYQAGRYDYMVLMLWLMCQAEDPQLTRDTFDGWLDALGISGVIPLITAVGEAMQAAFPDADETADETEDAEAEADPT